jgi:hypothetical protein
MMCRRVQEALISTGICGDGLRGIPRVGKFRLGAQPRLGPESALISVSSSLVMSA